MTNPSSEEARPGQDEAEAALLQDSLLGTVFDKRYELLALLGAGASGTAYKGRDVFMERVVVVKILHKYLLASPQALERFRKEALTTTAFSHHGIIRVYSHGVAEDGRPYMVMDCLEGKSLLEVLRTQGKLSLERFFNLFLQIIEALSFAHEQGVVHRDIKPSNIIIVKEESGERAVIVDFGIARIMSENGDQGSTKTGALLGSSAYMSPEQCKGVPADQRSDIYSLGCVMFESLLGSAPFQGESQMEVMYKHLNESAGKLGQLTELPEVIAGILRKCLARDVSARYQSLIELKADLQKCLEMQDTIKRRWVQAQSKKRHVWGFVAAAVVGALVLAAAAAVVILLRPSYRLTPPDVLLKPSPRGSVQTVSLPKTKKGISGLVDELSRQAKYSEVLAILLKWEKDYSASSLIDHDARVYVLETLVVRLEQEKMITEESRYLEQLQQLDQSPGVRLFAAAHRAQIYRAQGQAEKGISEVETVLQTTPIPEPDEKLLQAEIECMVAEADCHFDCDNTQKASDLYFKATELSKKCEQGFHETEKNISLRNIVALTKLGRTADAEKMISACLKGVVEDEKLVYSKKQERDERQVFLMGRSRFPGSPGARTRPANADAETEVISNIFLSQLAHEFLQRGDAANYKKYLNQVIDRCSSAGQVNEASRMLREQEHWLRESGDLQGAVEAAKRLLSRPDSADFATKLARLVDIATLYNYQLHERKLAHEYEERAYNLVLQQIDKEPDLLYKQPNDSFPNLLRCMMASHPTSLAEPGRRIDLFISRCRSQDCYNLQHFYLLKEDCLELGGKLDESLALCKTNLESLARRKPAEADYCYEWLARKGGLLIRKGKNEEALQAYTQGYNLVAQLPQNTKEAKEKDALIRLAQVMSVLGRNSEALKYYGQMEAKTGLHDIQGIRNSDFDCLLTLGWYCVGQGDYARANDICEALKKARASKFGEDRQDLIQVLYLQAVMLRQQNKLPEARKLFEKVRDRCLKYKLDQVDDPMYKEAVKALAAAGKS